MQLGKYQLGPNDFPQNGIYTGDALCCLRDIPDRSVDAFVMDPPYCSGAISESKRTRAKGQGLRSKSIERFGWFIGDNMGTAGLTYLLRSIAIEARRICKPTSSLFTFCDWRMIPALEPAIESTGLRWQGLIVWDKGHMGLGAGFRCQHEIIMHFTFGAPSYYDRGTANVLYSQRVPSNERLHQTQKPIDLLNQLIHVAVPAGGIVCDPFCGSGSTCVSAKILGRRYLAFEIDPDIAELARNRVRNTQPPLFIPEPEQLEIAL